MTGLHIQFVFRLVPFFFFCLALSFCFVSSPSFGATLSELNVVSAPEKSEVILMLDGPISYNEFHIPAAGALPDRFYFDLHETRLASHLSKRIAVNDKHIGDVRIGIHNDSVRVVVDLRPGNRCFVTKDHREGQIVFLALSSSSPVFLKTPPSSPDPVSQEEGVRQLEDSSSLFVDSPKKSPFMPALDIPLMSPKRAWKVSGRFFGFGAADLKKEPAEDHRLARLRSRLGFQYEDHWGEQVKIQGNVTGEWDVLDYDNAGRENDLDLYEAYLKFSGVQWDFSVGRQRVRWGKSDQLSPLDSINHEDLRQFITLDLEERKLPSWLARLRLHGEKFTVETILNPWFEKSELDYFDSDWALYRNLRQIILTNPSLPQPVKSYAGGLRVHEREPSNSLRNMSGALRLTWQGEASDYALSYRYGWEALPTIARFPVKGIVFSGDPASNPAEFLSSAVLTPEVVEASYNRQQIAGFEWETAFALFGFRGELAYIDQVAFLGEDLTSVSKEAAHLVAGIDYTSANEWYLNLQGSWYRIFGYNDTILYFERDTLSILGEVRKTLWRGNLEFSTRYNYTLTDGSSYWQPAITLKYFTNTEIELGVMIFEGDGETLLGSYDNADQVYGQIKVSF